MLPHIFRQVRSNRGDDARNHRKDLSRYGQINIIANVVADAERDLPCALAYLAESEKDGLAPRTTSLVTVEYVSDAFEVECRQC